MSVISLRRSSAALAHSRPLPTTQARARSTPSTPTSRTASRSKGLPMRLLILPFCAALSWVAAAQTFDGINAPVSRTVTLPADEAAFTIAAAANLDSTAQQVKQSLQSAGLPNPTVVAIGLGQDTSIYPPGPAQVLYSATVTIPAGSAMDAA